MSVGRKMFLGRATDVPCKSCGRKVGVVASSMIMAYIPFAVAFIAALSISQIRLRIAVLVGGAAVTFLLWWLWLPLQKRD